MNKLKLGTTFIEILIYMALLTTILALVTNLYYQVANFKQNQQIESSLLHNSSLVFNRLSLDIKQSSTIIEPIDQNFDGRLVVTIGDNQVTYEVIDGVLKRNNVELTDNMVVVNLSPPSFGFRQISNSIQIILNIQAKAKPFGLPPKAQVYQTTISLRN